MIGITRFLSARRVQFLGWFLVAAFAWLIAAFYDPRNGFTSLLAIGAKLDDSTVPRLKAVPHYVYDGSYGYDGAYYVQLALHPTLAEPELQQSIDNLPYRAKRMLLYWTAALVGFGHDAWVVNAYALLNVIAWIALAWRLLRWFPLNTYDHLLRWAGILFSHGVCMSVRHSLVDLPALLFVALAMAVLERGHRNRSMAALAAAALTKETSLLAATALFESGRSEAAGSRWLRWVAAVVLVALPLVLWSGYVRWRVGAVGDAGLKNFTWPLVALIENWGTVISDLQAFGWSPAYSGSLLASIALTVQGAFMFTRWQPANPWWRVGATFAGLMLVVAEPVWEGYPGATTRVLLPMSLAFNVLVPRGRRWLPVLIAGNLTLLLAPAELAAPREFFEVKGDAAVRAVLTVERAGDWYGAEVSGGRRWRWSAGTAGLKVINASPQPIRLVLHGSVGAPGDERTLRLFLGEAMVWSGPIQSKRSPLDVGVVVPPGESRLQFKTDRPPVLVGADPRLMAFKVVNLEIVAPPVNGQR